MKCDLCGGTGVVQCSHESHHISSMRRCDNPECSNGVVECPECALKDRAISFAYNLVYENLQKVKRSRTMIGKKYAVDKNKELLVALQKIMNKDLEMDIEFKEL